MQKTLAIAATFVALVLVASGLWSYLSLPATVAPEYFPQKMSERVLLPGADQQEVNRKVIFEEDGFTVKRVSVDYPDGSSGYAIYRADGTVETVYKFYPQVDGSPSVKMMESHYGEDGEHLDSEKHFYADGSVKRTGERMVSGDYLVYDIGSAETSKPVESVFSAAGTKYDVVERHANGNFAKLALTENGATATTTFFETGLKATYHRAYYTSKVWETYQADGKSLVVKFEVMSSGDHHGVSYHVLGSYFNEDGTLNHTREFTRYYMAVRFYDGDGNFTHMQRWNQKPATDKFESLAFDQWFLISVNMTESGIGTSFQFGKDGKLEKYFKQVTLSNGEIKLETREYYPDGNLKLFRRPNPADLTGKFITDNFEPGESDEYFDSTLIEGMTEMSPYQVPPELPPEAVYGGM